MTFLTKFFGIIFISLSLIVSCTKTKDNSDINETESSSLIKAKDMTPPSRDPNVVKAKREQWRATKRAKYKGTQVKANLGK